VNHVAVYDVLDAVIWPDSDLQHITSCVRRYDLDDGARFDYQHLFKLVQDDSEIWRSAVIVDV
jgi:hypothetical protein